MFLPQGACRVLISTYIIEELRKSNSILFVWLVQNTGSAFRANKSFPPLLTRISFQKAITRFFFYMEDLNTFLAGMCIVKNQEGGTRSHLLGGGFLKSIVGVGMFGELEKLTGVRLVSSA